MTGNYRRSVSLDGVTIDGGFWGARQEVNRTVSLPVEYQRCEETGRFAVFDLDWKPGDSYHPHHFYDSDVAKWIEASAYALARHPDPELEAQVDAIIERIAAAQQADGYLNTYYTIIAPDKRWSNLQDMHELYCAGHLIGPPWPTPGHRQDAFWRPCVATRTISPRFFGPGGGSSGYRGIGD